MKIKYGTEYKLNTEEQELITNMSNKICDQGRTYFKSKYKIDRKMDLNQMNLNGFGAELAFCKLCNIPFDNTTNQYENHFNKVDATLKNGKTVDIKNTIYKTGKLLIRQGKEKMKVDLYALMIGEYPNYVFSGWASYDDIINNKNLQQFKYSKSYVLTQEQLNKELDVD